MNTPQNGIQWLRDATAYDLLQRFPLPIALIDAEGKALLLNDRFERAYGVQAVAGAPLQELLRDPDSGWHTVAVKGRGRDEVEVKAQVLRVQNDVMLILDDVADPGLMRQLGQLQGQITELERLNSIDRLTGAWNRAHFDRVIAAELDRSIRYRQPVSLIILDVDHFKRINDSYGHHTGDAVLCELVKVVRSAVRSIDLVFRWGGEEFVVLAASSGYRGGGTLAEKVRAKVEQHRFAGVGAVTVSLGVAEHDAVESAQIWFQRADRALYDAKDGGRNRVCVDRRGSSDLWAAQSGLSALHLQWQEAYECGEPTIDREHRELFELSNALLDASLSSNSSAQAVNEALEPLLAHVAQHFANEEALLAQHEYASLEAHRRAHLRLLERAGELKAAAAGGKATLGELVEFLANTVVAQHLFKVDREFYPLFKKN